MKLVITVATLAAASAFTANAPVRSNLVNLRASTMDDVDVENNEVSSKKDERISLSDRITNSGVASAAAMATAAVNAAVSMKTLEAPDVEKSYIALDKTKKELDEEGLPLVYDKDLIEQYWSKERGALNKRWGYFVGKAVPFLTKLTTLFIRDGKIADSEIPELSRQARVDLQDLGPTFIKAGQMMSVRPDVLPQVCMHLKKFGGLCKSVSLTTKFGLAYFGRVNKAARFS